MACVVENTSGTDECSSASDCTDLKCNSDFYCEASAASNPGIPRVECSPVGDWEHSECFHWGCNPDASGDCIKVLTTDGLLGNDTNYCDTSEIEYPPVWSSRGDYNLSCSHLDCSFLTCERVADAVAGVIDVCTDEKYFSGFCLTEAMSGIINPPETTFPTVSECVEGEGSKFDRDLQEECCGTSTVVGTDNEAFTVLTLVNRILGLFGLSASNPTQPDNNPALMVRMQVVPLQDMSVPDTSKDTEYLTFVGKKLSNPILVEIDTTELETKAVTGELTLGSGKYTANTFNEPPGVGTYQVKYFANALANKVSTPLHTTKSPLEIEEDEAVAAMLEVREAGYKLACLPEFVEHPSTAVESTVPPVRPASRVSSSVTNSIIPQLTLLTEELAQVFENGITGPSQTGGTVLGVDTSDACPETIRRKQVSIDCLENVGDSTGIELTSFVDIQSLIDDAEAGILKPSVSVPFLAHNAGQLFGTRSIEEERPDSKFLEDRASKSTSFFGGQTLSPIDAGYEVPASDADMGEFRLEIWLDVPDDPQSAVEAMLGALDWFADVDPAERAAEIAAAVGLLFTLGGRTQNNPLSIDLPGKLAYVFTGYNKTAVEQINPQYQSPLFKQNIYDWTAPTIRPSAIGIGGTSPPPTDPPTGDLATILANAEAATQVAKEILGALLSIEGPAYYADPNRVGDCEGEMSLCGAKGPMQILSGREFVDCDPCDTRTAYNRDPPSPCDSTTPCPTGTYKYSYCCSPYYCDTATRAVKDQYASWFDLPGIVGNRNICYLPDALSVAGDMLKAKAGGVSSITLNDTEYIVRAVMSYYGNAYNSTMTPAQNCHKDTKISHLGGRTYCEYVFWHAGIEGQI